MNAPFNTIFVAVMDTLEQHCPYLAIETAAKITRELSDKFYDLLESATDPAAVAPVSAMNEPPGVEEKDAKADDDRRPLHPFHNMKSLADVADDEPTAPGPDEDDLEPDHEPPPAAPIEEGVHDPETLQTAGGGSRMSRPETKTEPPEKPLPESARKILAALLELRERGMTVMRPQLRNKVRLDPRSFGQAMRSLLKRGYVTEIEHLIAARCDLDGNRLDGPEPQKDERGVTVCPPRYATGYGYEPSPYGR